MNIEIGNKKIDFVYQGDNLIYPNYPARENLILHYDFSGMKNSDVTKDIARDLSGNGNNGVLQNFAYIDGSGYLDNELIFDGIDDFITIPEPQIDLDNFTYSEGINVLSFRGDNVATVVDGVVEIGGRNYLVYSSLPSWVTIDEGIIYQNGNIIPITFSKKIPVKYGDTFIASGSYFMTAGTYFNMYVETYDVNNAVIVPEYRIYLPINPNTEVFFNHIIEITNTDAAFIRIRFGRESYSQSILWYKNLKLEKGNKATDWTPAPEDVKTTTFKPLFDKKIKSALYWNRALTDEELLQVYNTQIKRI